MGRYTGPSCKLCRREGVPLMLKGQRCLTDKCAVKKKKYPPGPPRKRRSKLSEYGIQLREKQKLRRIYQVREKQFRRYVAEAERRKGITGENLLQILEMRLDNVVFRLGFAASRLQARQFVNHGHVRVNGRVVGIPSYMVRPGDKLEIRPSSKKMAPIEESIRAAASGRTPAWLTANYQELSSEVLSAPTRAEIDTDIEEALIVEFYSR